MAQDEGTSVVFGMPREAIALGAAQAGGCEDWEVALRVAAKHRVAVVPEVLLGYRRRPGNMSSACDTMWRSHQLVMEGEWGLGLSRHRYR